MCITEHGFVPFAFITLRESNTIDLYCYPLEQMKTVCTKYIHAVPIHMDSKFHNMIMLRAIKITEQTIFELEYEEPH